MHQVPIDIGIGEDDRREIAEGLARLLADSYTLYLKTHNYHWNVTGPMFNSLHLMFEEQYEDLAGAVDEIAERIRALGFRAPGSYAEFGKLTSIPEEAGMPDAMEMIANLAEGHQACARTARAALPAVERVDDQPTMEMLAARLQIHEKKAWMLRSLLA